MSGGVGSSEVALQAVLHVWMGDITILHKVAGTLPFIPFNVSMMMHKRSQHAGNHACNSD